MGDQPRAKFYCRQCNKSVGQKKQYSARSLIEHLLKLPTGDRYDFENDCFCGSCRDKLISKQYRKLPPLREPRRRKVLPKNPEDITEAGPGVAVNDSRETQSSHGNVNLIPHSMKKCLVCLEECSNSGIKLKLTENIINSDHLAKQLDVIFIFRHLLQVPSTALERYVKDFGNPGEWKVSLCSHCSEKASLARNFHQTIVNATIQLKMIQSKFVEKIKGGGEFKLANEDDQIFSVSVDCPSSEQMLIFNETKQFVMNHDYGSKWAGPGSPHFVEDKLAAELSAGLTCVDKGLVKEDVTVPEDMESKCNFLESFADDDDGGQDLHDDTQTTEETDQDSVLRVDVTETKMLSQTEQLNSVKILRGKRFMWKMKHKGHGPPITCHLCQQLVETDAEWKWHLETDHQLNCMICPLEDCRKEMSGTSRMQSYRRHMLVHQNSSELTCDVCGKVFNWKRNRVRHEKYCRSAKSEARLTARKLKEEKRLRQRNCVICNQVFLGVKALSIHNKEVHAVGVKSADAPLVEHKCRFCGCKRKSKLTLEKHIRQVHQNSNKDILFCDICGFGCSTPTYFKVHMLSKHNGDPAAEALRQQGYSFHKCSVKGCRKIFVLQEEFEKHMQKFHQEADGGRPFNCSYCGKGFFDSFNLSRHELIHANAGTANYQCTLCGKRFSIPQYLYIHERYTCPHRAEKKDNKNTL